MASGLHAKGSLIFLVPLAGKTQNFKLEGAEVLKKKKLQIGTHIVLTNYKYTKFLFLSSLRCNHLPTKKKKIIIIIIKTKTKTK